MTNHDQYFPNHITAKNWLVKEIGSYALLGETKQHTPPKK